jgi:GST-like protein
MIEFYYWPTPNGHKVSIMLEECGLEYSVERVDIGAGEQFSPGFLAISPNNRMPAIVDSDNGIAVFESGAILMYLAEKTDSFLPRDPAGRYDVLQWLFWQMANLGPTAGQLSHYVNYARESVPYAHERHEKEYDRLLAVMDVRLRDREYLGGEYSIADMACFPWIIPYRRFGFELDRFQNLRRWFDAIKSRETVQQGVNLGKGWRRDESRSEKARAVMFGQDSATVYAAAGKQEK